MMMVSKWIMIFFGWTVPLTVQSSLAHLNPQSPPSIGTVPIPGNVKKWAGSYQETEELYGVRETLTMFS